MELFEVSISEWQELRQTADEERSRIQLSTKRRLGAIQKHTAQLRTLADKFKEKKQFIVYFDKKAYN